MIRRRAVCGLVLAGVLALAAPARGQEALPVLARVGPWPVVSYLVGYRGRIWFANSVKGRNHNSADIYAYDPKSAELRYLHHLFSQDAGQPLVAGGLLYWPWEDSRFSLGWGHFSVTDGVRWRFGTIPTAQIFHTHAMASVGGRLLAATSAWRAGLQESADGGVTWRQVYDHPTPTRRVSRIVELATVGERVFGTLIDRGRPRVLRLEGDAVADLPGWPRDRPVLGLAGFQGRLYGLVAEPDGVAVWRSDGVLSQRLAGPRRGWRLRALAAGADGLWAASAEAGDGILWHSRDGREWRPRYRLAGGTPHAVTLYAGRAYVGGAGADGRGILWGPPAPAPVEAAAPAAELPPRLPPAPVDWRAAAADLDRALAVPANYRRHGPVLRDLAFEFAQARPPPDFFAERLRRPMPDQVLELIGGRVKVPAARVGRRLLLWAMAVAGRGRVPPALIAEPWTAPANPAEKYFEPAPAALWAAAVIGQRDRATLAAMIDRLDHAADPPWLRGDVVGALSALSGQRFGYDLAAWRAWWTAAAPSWPENP